MSEQRKAGYYWIMVDGEPIIAEFVTITFFFGGDYEIKETDAIVLSDRLLPPEHALKNKPGDDAENG